MAADMIMEFDHIEKMRNIAPKGVTTAEDLVE